MTDKNMLLKVLKKEIEISTGCTDPGSVALAVAKATEALKGKPQKVKVAVSANVYKNGVGVGIPGTGKRGLHQAAVLGIHLAEWVDEKLGIMNHVDDKMVEDSQKVLEQMPVEISYMKSSPDPLYVKAEVESDEASAWAIIQGDYSNIMEVGRNGKTIFSKQQPEGKASVATLINHKVSDLVETISDMPLEELRFLIDASMVNKEAAIQGLKSSKTRMGAALYQDVSNMGFPCSAIRMGKFYTASASEARMVGLNVPIMAIAGSGNHGITNFLGVLAVAESLKSRDIQFARALAISSTITIYIKGYIKRMTAFCGCSVAASTGVAAATVYLLGGNYKDMENAMGSVLGALAGIVCDGAKESCGYKLSTATSTAIEYAYLAKEKGVFIPRRNGIIAGTIEETFQYLGQLNNPGMKETDKCILEIVNNIQNK